MGVRCRQLKLLVSSRCWEVMLFLSLETQPERGKERERGEKRNNNNKEDMREEGGGEGELN